jgi:hypothetical protein
MEWTDGERVLLRDKEGVSWWLDVAGGEATPVSSGTSGRSGQPGSEVGRFVWLPALIYSTSEGVWRAEAEGQAELLLPIAHAHVSPDGQRALYVTDAGTMVVDLASGTEIELPVAKGYSMARWPRWAGKELILFGAFEAGAELGPSFGYLSAAAADGSWVRVLDTESVSNALPAISPDWQTIAYDKGGTAWLYHWDSGPAKLDVAAHGLTQMKSLRIGSPVWSPDGQRLAWVVGGNFDAGGGAAAGWRICVAVLDLEEQTSQLLHLYEPLGVGGWPEPPVWSPDGQWLAYVVWPVADPDLGGVWVLRADGLEERRLGPGQVPLWSPYGRWLVYSEPGGARGTTVWRVETDGWEAQRMDLPAGALAVGWVEDSN